jgi:hypothetical protein
VTTNAIGPSNVYPFPAIRPGHRLVPAKVARSGETGVIAFIECPNWCVEDHVADYVGSLQDVMHRGENAYVAVPTFAYGAYPVQMHASVQLDPAASDPQMRAAHVLVSDSTGNNDAYLTPEMADAVADELIGLASELRHKARTARLHNASQGAQAEIRGEAV